MRRTSIWAGALIALAVAAPSPAHAQASALPIFDAHVHYNLDIGRPVPVETVFELWRRAGIRGVLLTSRPNDGTRELLAAAPPEFRTVAFARPYVVASDAFTWFKNPAILAHDRAGDRARHLPGDRRVPHLRPRRRQRRLRALRAARLPASAVAACSLRRLRDRAHLLARSRRAGDLGTHRHDHATGARRRAARALPAALRRAVLPPGSCRRRRTVFDLARTVHKYPQRFLLGSDTWVPQRWPEVPDIMAGYRAWLSQLPPNVAERIAWRNGATLFLGQ